MAPTDKDLQDPEFNAIWNVIKNWAISENTVNLGLIHCRANAAYVRRIIQPLRELRASPSVGIRMPQTHELKCWPEYFEPIYARLKTFEVRRNDRDFQAGDPLVVTGMGTGHEKV